MKLSFRILILTFLFNIFSLNLAFASYNTVGYLGGFGKSEIGYGIWGWACQTGLSQSIDVDVFIHDQNGQKTLLQRKKANISHHSASQDNAIRSICGTSGVLHGFAIPLSYNEVLDLSGRSISAEAINSINQHHSLPPANGGQFNISIDNTSVFTDKGWVQGTTNNNTTSSFSSVVSFKGIPYATPPVGQYRWHKPVPHQPWSNVRDASQFSKACPQDNELIANSSLKSEDCLTINVWKKKNKKNLPVVVYIHGGAFKKGSSRLPIYDGTYMASKDVIYVSFNYRVGIFGFFSHPYLRDNLYRTGMNFGLHDQLAALQWVNQNIAEFGGNPNNVTIMGSSAGGASVGYWMSNRLGQGLFHRAIMESGGASFTHNLENWQDADIKSNDFIEELLTDYNSELPVCAHSVQNVQNLSNTCLQQVLLNTSTQTLMKTSLFKSPTFHPFQDNYFVVEGTANRFSCGTQKKLPMIVGSMGWESSVVQDQMNTNFQPFFYGFTPNLIEIAYTGYGDNLRVLAEDFYGDKTFGAPSQLLADLHSQSVPKTYLYLFNYVGENMASVRGAPHHILNAYTLGTLSSKPELTAAYNPTQKDKNVSKVWNEYWLSFIKNDFNSNQTISSNFNSGRDWQPYDSFPRNRLFVNYYGSKNSSGQRLYGDGVTRNKNTLLAERYGLIEALFFNDYFSRPENSTCAPQ